jgi:hypothetical protein
MITKTFFTVNRYEIVIFKLNFNFSMKNLWEFVAYFKNLHTRSRSQVKKLWIRLQQNITAPPAPAH